MPVSPTVERVSPMPVFLTPAQIKILVSALDRYRIAKGAEGKLSTQRLLATDRTASADLELKYRRLAALISETTALLLGNAALPA